MRLAQLGFVVGGEWGKCGTLKSAPLSYYLLVIAGYFVYTAAGPAAAQPVGGSVVSGNASISMPGAGATTLITQSSQKAIINWQDFSVAAGQTVQFAQPNQAAVTLNRVTGGGISDIQGTVRANGQVWLINPNGVLFGQGATVHVGGLLATTADIADSDFLSGNYVFSGGGSSAGVTNKGRIHAARGGSVVLSGAHVTNQGLIAANSGHIVLGGADAFTVDFNGDHLLSYAVTAPVAHDSQDANGNTQSATVSNSGIIRAAGGKVLLTARAAADVTDSVVNNSGIVRATSARMDSGDIILDAGDGTAEAGGTLDASGKAAGQIGGSVQVLGKTVQVTDDAKIDVSGDAGGGQVLIGGNFHGAGPQRNAQATMVGKAAISADAIVSGMGGKVAIWSDGQTKFAGVISAKGGAVAGDGGQVETSGHFLDVAGARVNASAPNGVAGAWLLDPYNLTVSNTVSTATQAPAGTWTADANGTVVLNTDINSALNSGTSVVLQTSGFLGDGQGNGDITVSSAIQMTGAGAASLTLKAGGSIIVNQGISSIGGALALTLDANTLGGGGAVSIQAPIATAGGALIIGGGATPLTTAAVGTAALINGVLVNGTLDTAGGAVTIHGLGYGGSGNGNTNNGVSIAAAINAGGGAVSIFGQGGNSTGNGNRGVVVGGTITSTGGITLFGTGSGSGAGGNDDGVGIFSSIFGGAGPISITGIAGDSGGTGATNYGVNVNAAISGGGGAISITGTGGNSSGNNNYGIFQHAAVTNSGAGAITLNGAGGGTGNTEIGYATDRNVTTGTGNISITGVASANATGASNNGINVLNATTSTAGAGTITMVGTTAGSGLGISLTNSVIAAVNGLINLTGTNISTAISAGNNGINSNNNTAITSTGLGGILLNGTAGGSGAGGADVGVNLAPTSILQSTGGGAITITGTGGNSNGNGNFGINQSAAITTTGGGGIVLNGTGGGNGGTGAGNIGVSIGSTISSGGGAITITGTGGNSSGNNNYGIGQAAAITNIGTGAITLSGTGGGTGGAGRGYSTTGASANITAGTGNISITGVGTAAGGGGGTGITFGGGGTGGTISTAGAGTITILGTATFAGFSGVVFSSSELITAVDGLISITGINNSTDPGAGFVGVNVGSTIQSTGLGGITVTGTGGGSGAGGGDYGVVLNFANALQSTGGGAITITGIGGDSGGTGANNYGVNIANAFSGSGGAISITGIGGNSHGINNYGISQTAAITNTGAGSIVLNGTGGGSGNGEVGYYTTDSVTAAMGNIFITGNAHGTGGFGFTGIQLLGGLSTSGSVTLQATGSIVDGFGINPATAGYIFAQAGLTATSTFGGILLFNSGNGLGNPGHRISGPVSFNSAGGVLFFNGVATNLGSSVVGSTLTVSSASDLTINAGATLQSLATSGDGVVLVVGRNFFNNSGSNAVQLNGSRALGFFQSPANIFGALLDSQNTAIWGTSYPAPIAATGHRYVFAQPQVITITSINLTKAPGTDATAAVAGAYLITGLQPGLAGAYLGDTAAAAYSGTPSVTSAGSLANASAFGSPYAINVAAGSFAALNGYSLNLVSSGQLTFGVPTAVITGGAPVLISIVAANQASAAASTVAQFTSFTVLNNMQTVVTPPPTVTGAAATYALASAPPAQNPLQSLVLSSSTTEVTFQPPAEPPTPADLSTDLVVASMDGGTPVEKEASTNTNAAANRSTIIIPGLLSVAPPGKMQSVVGSGDDLSAWGNPALWQ